MSFVLDTSTPSPSRVARATAAWAGPRKRSTCGLAITARVKSCATYASSLVASGEINAANWSPW